MSPRKTPPRYKRTKSLGERKERILANQRKYRETHQEQIKAYKARTRDAAKARWERFKMRNPDHSKNYYKQYAQKNRARIRARNILKWYGITIEQWNAVFSLQGEKCAICRSAEPGGWWCADHDHATNKFRGILCRICNVMLGHAKDEVSILERAIEYLKNPPYQG